MNNPNDRHITQGEQVQLKDHFEMRIDGIEKYFNSEIRNLKEGIRLAKHDNEIRLSGMNEFRSTLEDQARRFVTRNEVIAWAGIISGIVSTISMIVLSVLKG
jgi:hypothetical protein